MNAEVLSDPRATPPMKELPADTSCLGRDRHKYDRKGYTIDCCLHTVPWGQGVQVTSPCCGADHRNVASGDMVKCRMCGRWYRVFYKKIDVRSFYEGVPFMTRWVSAGRRDAPKRKRA